MDLKKWHHSNEFLFHIDLYIKFGNSCYGVKKQALVFVFNILLPTG